MTQIPPHDTIMQENERRGSMLAVSLKRLTVFQLSKMHFDDKIALNRENSVNIGQA